MEESGNIQTIVSQTNTFLAYSNQGKLSLGTEYNRSRFRKDLADNDGARYKIERVSPESREQRGFYHGAVIPLWAFLDGNDWRDSNTLEHYHHEAKKEFNGGMIMRNGKQEVYGKSTKGELNKGYLDRVVDHLEEQYAIKRQDVLNPEEYKKWRDEIYGLGGVDNFIEYMVEIGKLSAPEGYVKEEIKVIDYPQYESKTAFDD